MTAKELPETSLIPPDREQQAFAQVVELIRLARDRAMAGVNTTLIDLHWQVGEFISQRIDTDGWGNGTVTALADYIRKHHPGVRGFSPQNPWRMRQFFKSCRDAPKLSALLRELPVSSNLHILAKAKRPEEREFYLRMAVQQRWSIQKRTQHSFRKPQDGSTSSTSGTI